MRWMLYSGISAVFALGGVAGGLLGVTVERDRVKKLERGAPGIVAEMTGKRLEQELKLDPAQARRVRQVLADARPQIEQLEQERRRKLREVMERTHPEILSILTPAQRGRFLQLQHRIRQRLHLRDDPATGSPEPGQKKI